MADVKGVCSELLPDLDEDIFDYIVGILEDVDFGASEDTEDTAEMIAGLLSSADYCDSEEAAADLAKKLLTNLGSGSGTSNSESGGGASSDVVPLKTIKALKIGDTIPDAALQEEKKPAGNTMIKELKEGDEALSKKAQRLASRRGGGGAVAKNIKKSNKPTALELAEKETDQCRASVMQGRIGGVTTEGASEKPSRPPGDSLGSMFLLFFLVAL